VALGLAVEAPKRSALIAGDPAAAADADWVRAVLRT
jgi:hypothetical protein